MNSSHTYIQQIPQSKVIRMCSHKTIQFE